MLWYLPGGFVLKREPIEMAASRILKERTGLDKIFLQQFHVFGDPERSKEHFDMYKDMLPAKENWFTNRFLTIGYYALVDFIETNPTPDQLSAACVWRGLDDLHPFKLDHALILKTALDTLAPAIELPAHMGYNLDAKGIYDAGAAKSFMKRY